MTVEVSLPVHKLKMYEEKINKFNSECYAILNKKITKNDKTSIFKRTMKSNYETLINEMIQIRNLKQVKISSKKLKIVTKFVSLKFSKLTKIIDDLHFFVICYFLFVLYFVPVNYVILIVFLSL